MIARAFQTLALLAALGVLGFVLYRQAAPLFIQPCSTPIEYYIAGSDERFGISEAELQAALLEAEALWEKEAGRDLFTASTKGMGVRLVYGKEQRTQDLGKAISKEQEDYDAKKEEVEGLKNLFEKARSVYERKAAEYDALSALYHEQVNYWNAKGGAPEKEYQEINGMHGELQRLREALNTAAEEANDVSNAINARVDELNAYARVVNAKVEVYNTHAEEEFDQGEYQESDGGRSITVYEFKNTKDLIRVLAHEFGHALQIGHVGNPSSIMYSYNAGSSLELSEEDIIALRLACRLD